MANFILIRSKPLNESFYLNTDKIICFYYSKETDQTYIATDNEKRETIVDGNITNQILNQLPINSCKQEDTDDFFGVVKWNNVDIEDKLKEMGIPDTRNNIDKVRTLCEGNLRFTDRMIEAGWEIIEDTINFLIETGEIKNNETT